MLKIINRRHHNCHVPYLRWQYNYLFCFTPVCFQIYVIFVNILFKCCGIEINNDTIDKFIVGVYALSCNDGCLFWPGLIVKTAGTDACVVIIIAIENLSLDQKLKVKSQNYLFLLTSKQIL